MAGLNVYPDNVNFLSPLGFRFFVKKLPNVNFFTQSANIPSITLGTVTQPTPFINIARPGDKLSFGELRLSFRVDEDMKNYMEVYNWLNGLGRPDSFQQYADIQATNEVISDGVLTILNSAKSPIAEVTYQGMFPTSLGEINFTTEDTEVSYISCDVTFTYQKFVIKSLIV